VNPYYMINKDVDLLDSHDLPEMQMYILFLKYLRRMGEKEGVTPAEDWEKVKDLMARVKNHISFHARGVKPSEITVEFFSPEVKRLFHAVYGNGSATWTKEWLDTFESVKDEIDRQVENERPVCQFAAISGKRCDNCRCPDPPLSEQGGEIAPLTKENYLSYLTRKGNEGKGYDFNDFSLGVGDAEPIALLRQAWIDSPNENMQQQLFAEINLIGDLLLVMNKARGKPSSDDVDTIISKLCALSMRMRRAAEMQPASNEKVLLVIDEVTKIIRSKLGEAIELLAEIRETERKL